jgi:glucose-6-phosphate 1-dehydrogenase
LLRTVRPVNRSWFDRCPHAEPASAGLLSLSPGLESRVEAFPRSAQFVDPLRGDVSRSRRLTTERIWYLLEPIGPEGAGSAMDTEAPRMLADARPLEPPPCSVIIFGGAGDLARRKLLPALYNMHLDGTLSRNFVVVGFARTEHDDASYRQLARESVSHFSRRPVEAAVWEDFVRRIFYVRGGFDDATAYPRLGQRLEEIERAAGVPGNRIYYLSIPPSAIATVVDQLAAAQLATSTEDRFARVIVEKPIGRDLASARAINTALARAFDEGQTYRIDHYLGKETVQNIMVMRFANAIYEPLWNQKYIDHVQITVAETEGVGTRGGYYEEAGALRDMVQNHILQLLCLTTMEPPWSLAADIVRDQKLAVLQCLRPIAGTDVERYVVRAQYTEGTRNGEPVRGYRREDRVSPDSTTETYVALKVFVDNWRWAGVPFYLRTGKSLPMRASQIDVQFKEVPQVLFNVESTKRLCPNVLTLRIQPDEGFSLRISSKVPGAKLRIEPVDMDFDYAAAFGDQAPEAYERLLLDIMAGDATLFMRRDAVEASWTWITRILEAWEQSRARWLPQYRAGTWGPPEADQLIESDGRRWRTLG